MAGTGRLPGASHRGLRACAVVVALLLGTVACSGPEGPVTAGPAPSAGAPTTVAPVTTGTQQPTAQPVSPSASPSDDGAANAPDPARPVAPVERDRAAPVALDEVAQPDAGVTAKVTRVENVTGESILPGEVEGPALRLTVLVDNGTAEPLDLRGAVLNLYQGKARSPATALLEPGGVPFPAELAPGADATGVFVFRVATKSRAGIEVELDLTPTSTIVAFEDGA